MRFEDRISSLSDISFYVTQQNGTERPFTGALNKETRQGNYSCIVCETPTVYRSNEI
jgi:peptide-methionine (R)-S-oxide reductase